MKEEVEKRNLKANRKTTQELLGMPEGRYSSTPYDDVFRSLLQKCSKLIIPVVNELFQEHYRGDEKIDSRSDTFFKDKKGQEQKKIIADTFFRIIDARGIRGCYHLECQSTEDGSILIRMFDYDSQMALSDSQVVDGVLTVKFPKSAVLYLRSKKTTPDVLRIRIEVPEKSFEYNIPVLKVQNYELSEIFDKKLYFLIPFYLFHYEKDLKEYENNEKKREVFFKEYQKIMEKLEEARQKGDIDDFTGSYLVDMSHKVLQSLAKKYEKVRKGVASVMTGTIFETSSSRIRDAALREGREEGREEGIRALVETLTSLGVAEEKAIEITADRYKISAEKVRGIVR